MPRTRGQIRHPVNKGNAAEVFLRSKTTDPQGTRRHFGLGPGLDAFEDMPSLPAIPIWGYKAEYPFQNALNVDTTNVWTEVNDNAGTGLTVLDERGGIAAFTNDVGNNDFYYYVARSEIAALNSSKDLWFFTKMRILDVDQADWFIGLCAKVSAADALFDARVDSIGFFGTDGSAIVRLEVNKDSTSVPNTDGVLTLSDSTIVNLAFHVVGTSEVHFFGGLPGARYSYLGTIATNLPDDEEMAVAFGCRNGQASANAMGISRTIVIQDE
jgi:hypothetical protein